MNSKKSNKEIKELFELCEKHDWYHTFSDDAETYSRGSYAEKILIKKCSGTTLIKDFKNFTMSNINIGVKKLPKPLLENYLSKESYLNKCLMIGVGCKEENCEKCKLNGE